MEEAAWRAALRRLKEAQTPTRAQAWFMDLASKAPTGVDLRDDWRHALLRLAALNRIIDPSPPEQDGDATRASLRGVAVLLGALEGGLESRDVYDAESALYGALESPDPDVWMEAAELAERGRSRWGGALPDTLQATVIAQLVERGEIARAAALLPRVRWRQYTVKAVEALWPHSDAAAREASLDHADAVIADSWLPPVYSVEPLADLVILSASQDRLARLDALVASLDTSDLEPSQDFNDPRISLALARHACGHDPWALLADQEPGWLRWHGALLLAERTSGEPRAALIREAWATLRGWEDAWGGHVVETLELAPELGVDDALAWLLKTLERGDEAIEILSDLLLKLPEGPRQVAAPLIAARLPSLHGDALIAAIEVLSAVGFGDLDDARARLWDAAPAFEEDCYWWRDAAPLLPTALHDVAAARLLEGLDGATHYWDRQVLGDGILALYAAMNPATRDRWRDPLAARHALLSDLPDEIRAVIPEASRVAALITRQIDHARFRDRQILERILASLGWTLPRSILAPRQDTLGRCVYGRAETAAKMLALAWDGPVDRLDDGHEAAACRSVWVSTLTRPGPWTATETLAALAVRLGGLEMGAALLDDALAWAQTIDPI